MLQGLINKVVAGAIVAAAAIVAVVALGYAIYFGLTGVFEPWAAAAVTALLFAVVAVVVVKLGFGKAEPDEDEDEDEPQSMTQRVVGLVRERPMLGVAAGLAAGWIFLRNPALATIVAAAFNNGGHHHGRGHGRSRSRRSRR